MSEEKLSSWKEIAEYLKRDVSTIRRWEKEKRFPVHRAGGDKGASVYAYTAEIDGWLRENEAMKAVFESSVVGYSEEKRKVDSAQSNSSTKVENSGATIATKISANGPENRAKRRRSGVVALISISAVLGMSVFVLLLPSLRVSSAGSKVSPSSPSSPARSSLGSESGQVVEVAPPISKEMQEILIAQAKSVVKQSQIWEMLTLYAAPWNCDANDIRHYWDANSKAFMDVGESVSRLNERGWHYGYGTRLLDFEFLRANVSEDGMSAEIETRERWSFRYIRAMENACQIEMLTRGPTRLIIYWLDRTTTGM